MDRKRFTWKVLLKKITFFSVVIFLAIPSFFYFTKTIDRESLKNSASFSFSSFNSYIHKKQKELVKKGQDNKQTTDFKQENETGVQKQDENVITEINKISSEKVKNDEQQENKDKVEDKPTKEEAVLLPPTLLSEAKPQKGYLKEQVVSVQLPSENNQNSSYYIKAEKNGSSDVFLKETCGSAVKPKNCVKGTSTKEITANLWYKIDRDVVFTYAQDTKEETTFLAIAFDGKKFSTLARQTLFKIDKTPPTKLQVKNPSNGKWTKGSISLTLEAQDDGSGMHHFEYSYDQKNWFAYPSIKESFFITPPFKEDINQRLYIRACDVFSNCSTSVSTEIKIDNKAPTVPTMNALLQDGTKYIDDTWTKQEVFLSNREDNPNPVGSMDYGSGVWKYQISKDNKTWFDFSYHSANELYHIQKEGISKRYFRAIDFVGNISPVLTKIIKIDKTAPSISIQDVFVKKEPILDRNTRHHIEIISNVVDTAGVSKVTMLGKKCIRGTCEKTKEYICKKSKENIFTCEEDWVFTPTGEFIFLYQICAVDNADNQICTKNWKPVFVSTS